MDTRALAAATVLDTDGGAVRLSREWADRPVVIVWLRHFGCVFCREQVAELRARPGDHAPVADVLAALEAARALPVEA